MKKFSVVNSISIYDWIFEWIRDELCNVITYSERCISTENKRERLFLFLSFCLSPLRIIVEKFPLHQLELNFCLSHLRRIFPFLHLGSFSFSLLDSFHRKLLQLSNKLYNHFSKCPIFFNFWLAGWKLEPCSSRWDRTKATLLNPQLLSGRC